MKMRLEFRICRWMCILNNGYLRQGEIPAVVVIRKGWRRKAYIKYINKRKSGLSYRSETVSRDCKRYEFARLTFLRLSQIDIVCNHGKEILTCMADRFFQYKK